jgi:hypothetical protein
MVNDNNAVLLTSVLKNSNKKTCLPLMTGPCTNRMIQRESRLQPKSI